MTGYAKSDTATTESYTETDSSYDDGGRSPATPRRNRRVRQPSEPPPMVPEMDQPVPDVSLTSSTKGALLSAFAEGIPRGSALLYRDVFEEVHGQTADSSQFRGDPRWFLLYNHPLLVGLGLWIGARTFLDRRGMSPEDTSLAGNRPLGQLAEDLEVSSSPCLPRLYSFIVDSLIFLFFSRSILGIFWDVLLTSFGKPEATTRIMAVRGTGGSDIQQTDSHWWWHWQTESSLPK